MPDLSSFSEQAEKTNEDSQKPVTKTYLYEPDSFRPLAIIQNQQIYHYHLDHLGTPQELTHHNGELVWSVQYKVYGNVVKKVIESVENNLRFQGQYYDAETGLHYNRHRYYDPTTARFISLDPIGLLGGNNNYQYANNPITWVDPLGLSCKEVANSAKYYRYVGEGEAQAIRQSGKIPNVDITGNPKDVYLTNRLYKTAGRAKTHNQLPSKPTYRVEIKPENVPNRTPFTKSKNPPPEGVVLITPKGGRML